MRLDIEDDRLRARIGPIRENMLRLVLEYPREEPYPERVRTALADLLRPPSSTKQRGRRQSRQAESE